MNWLLIWVIGFLALYLLIGARGLAAIILTMIMSAFALQTMLGETGMILGGSFGLILGLFVFAANHGRAVQNRRAAV